MDEQQISALVAAYKDAIERIRAELLRLDLTDMSRANTNAALAEVAGILASLNAESAAWVAENIPEAARYGVAKTLVDIGVADSVKSAEKIAEFNRINRDMVAAVVADTQADLLAVTQNVDRRVKSVVRKVAADSMRANMASGVNGRRTISREILSGMRRELGTAVDTGLIDAAGRRWKPDVYVDMLTRTKIHATSREAAVNEAISRDALYGVISRHGATDACRKYEGIIVKLTPDAPGNYPYIGDLPRNEIFHPNCRHSVTPTRRPETITEPPSYKEKEEAEFKARQEKVTGIITDMRENGINWKPGSAESHLKKRVKKGYLPKDSNLSDYETRIYDIIKNKSNDVYVYSLKRFDQEYYVFGDKKWIAIVGEDGVFETAFPPDYYSRYLSKKDGYTRIGTIKELMIDG